MSAPQPAGYEIRFSHNNIMGLEALEAPINRKDRIPDPFRPRDKIPRAPPSSSDRQSEPPKKHNKGVRNNGSLATVAPELVTKSAAVTKKNNKLSQSVAQANAEKRDRVSRIPVSAIRKLPEPKTYEPKPSLSRGSPLKEMHQMVYPTVEETPRRGSPTMEETPRSFLTMEEAPRKGSPTIEETPRSSLTMEEAPRILPTRELPPKPYDHLLLDRFNIADEEAFKSRDKIARSPVPSMQLLQKSAMFRDLASKLPVDAADDDDNDEAAAFKSRDRIARSPVPSMQLLQKSAMFRDLASKLPVNVDDDDEDDDEGDEDKVVVVVAPVTEPGRQDQMSSLNSKLNRMIQEDPMMLDTFVDDEPPPSKPNTRVNNVGRVTKKKRSYSSGGSSSETEKAGRKQLGSAESVRPSQKIKKQKPVKDDEDKPNNVVNSSTQTEQMDIDKKPEIAIELPSMASPAEKPRPPRLITEPPITPTFVTGNITESPTEEEPPALPRKILNPDEMVIPTVAKRMRKSGHATSDGNGAAPVKVMGAYMDVTDEVENLFDPPNSPHIRQKSAPSGGRSRRNSRSSRPSSRTAPRQKNGKSPSKHPPRVPNSNIIDLNSTPVSKPRKQPMPSGKEVPERRARQEEWVMTVKDDDSSSTGSACRSEELAKLDAESRHAQMSTHVGPEAQHKNQQDSMDNTPKIVLQSPSWDRPATLDLERTDTSSISNKGDGKKNKWKKKKKADKKEKGKKAGNANKTSATNIGEDEDGYVKSSKCCCIIQ